MGSKKTERLYFDLVGDICIFLGKASDCIYNENRERLETLTKELIHKTQSKANYENCIRKINGILKDAQFRFDLPEHPEKHNGFRSEYLYIEPIMKCLGYCFNKIKGKK